VILAGSCASSVLKRQIDSEDHFGTQSPKFQVQSTGVDDRYLSYKVLSYKVCITSCHNLSRVDHMFVVVAIAYVFSFDLVNVIFLA